MRLAGMGSGSILLAALLAGCFFGPTPQQDAGSREDHFMLREYLSHKSAVETHPWRNSGERAHVEVEANAGPGWVKVQMTDGNGTEVYSRTFSGQLSSASDQTSPGAPGNWTVRLIYQDAVGSITMSADAVKEGREE